MRGRGPLGAPYFAPSASRPATRMRVGSIAASTLGPTPPLQFSLRQLAPSPSRVPFPAAAGRSRSRPPTATPSRSSTSGASMSREAPPWRRARQSGRSARAATPKSISRTSTSASEWRPIRRDTSTRSDFCRRPRSFRNRFPIPCRSQPRRHPLLRRLRRFRPSLSQTPTRSSNRSRRRPPSRSSPWKRRPLRSASRPPRVCRWLQSVKPRLWRDRRLRRLSRLPRR